MRTLMLSTLLMFAYAIPLSAQSVGREVKVGERVRIDRMHEGTVVQRDGRFVVVQPLDAGSAATREIALSDVSLLEARRCCNRGEGFAYGVLGGVVASFLGGIVLQGMSSDHGPNMAMAGAVILAVPLGVVGGVVGSTVLAPGRWVEVSIPSH